MTVKVDVVGRIHWSQDEWALIAQELQRKCVGRDLRTDKFSSREFEAAMQAVLPQERWREPVLEKVERQIQDALNRQTGSPVRALVVKWTPEEWFAIAKEVERIAPTAFDHELKNLTLKQLREAISILPKDRHRYPIAVSQFRAQLIQAFQNGAAKPESNPIFPSVATKQHGLVRWSSKEWLAVAREMHRQNPHATFLQSSTLAGVKLEEVKMAQVVLPPDRRRHFTTVSMGQLRPLLLDAFKALREELARNEEVEQQPVEREQEPAETPPEQVIEAAPVAPEDSLVMRIAEAMKPIMKLMAEEFWKSGRSVMEEMLLNILTTPTGQINTEKVETLRVAAEKKVQAQKGSKIALIGGFTEQQRAVTRDFPELEWVLVDANKHSDVTSAIRDCDQVIVWTRFIGHSISNKAKDIAKEKYVPVGGGLSAIKHQVNCMLKTGKIHGAKTLSA